MIRWIIGRSLRIRFLLVAVAALVMLFGITTLDDMPVDVVPDFTKPYVELQTEALGLSAEEVEAMITTPLEADMLNGAAWVDEIQSESMPGLSSIKLVFEPGTDILDARQMVQERLTQVYTLPSVSKPPVMLQPVASANRCLQIGLSSDTLSLIRMSVLARWTIKPRLMGVPGVANVSIWGQRERQLQVRVDPEKLEREDVSLDQIIETTGNSLWASPLTFLDAAVPGTGGFIDTPNQRLTVLHKSPITTADQLAEVVIAGTKKRLKDVAEVVEDHQPLIGDALVNDAPALMLVVEKFPWAHTSDVTHGVEAALEALAPAVAGVKMDASLFRPATYIETALGNMKTALLISGVLVAVTLFVLLGNWRSGVVGIVAVVTSLVTAGLVLYVLGVHVNMLIVIGLMLGGVVVIDDAVADIHNIVRRRHQHRDRGSAESVSWVIREAMVEMRGVTLYATGIVLLALVPAFFMQGVLGAFLQPAAYAYALAVIVSLLVGLTVTPAISILLFNRARIGAEESPIAGFVRRAYERSVAPNLNRPIVAFTVASALVVAGAVIVPNVRQEALFPTFKESDVVISVDAKPGTSHPAMSALVAGLGRKLRGISGVKNVGAHIGRAITSDEVADINSADLFVSIDPAAEHEATLAAIRKVVNSSAPNFLDRDVHTYLGDRTQQEVDGEERGLVVRVYGENLSKLEELAKDIANKLKTTDGVSNAKVEAPGKQPRIEIEPDLDKCMAHGIKPGDVRRQAAILLSGIDVGQLFEEQKVFDVVVWGQPAIRKNFESVKNLLIDTEEKPVPLKDLAHVRMGTGPTVINREAVARYIDVTADVKGRDLGGVGRDVQKVLGQVHFPQEYRAELLGGPAERLASQERVLAYAIAALIGIYLLLQIVCNSWRVAVLVMLMLPLSMVGGAAAALASGGTISYGSMLGFIALLAIAARSCVLLVRRYQQLGIKTKAEPLDPEVAAFRDQFNEATPLNDVGGFDRISAELVLAGTCQRFVPLLASTAAILLACLPFVLTDAGAGFEILRPMAIVISGGLVTTALVNLYVLPALYLWLNAEPLPDIVTEPLKVGARAQPTEGAPQPAAAT